MLNEKGLVTLDKVTSNDVEQEMNRLLRKQLPLEFFRKLVDLWARLAENSRRIYETLSLGIDKDPNRLTPWAENRLEDVRKKSNHYDGNISGSEVMMTLTPEERKEKHAKAPLGLNTGITIIYRWRTDATNKTCDCFGWSKFSFICPHGYQ